MQSTTLLDLKYQHSINRAILTGPCMTLYFRGGGEGCTRNVALAYQKSRAFTVDLTYATQCVHMYHYIRLFLRADSCGTHVTRTCLRQSGELQRDTTRTQRT